MLKLTDVVVRYPKVAEPALDRLSLSFEQGEFVCVLGKSGAGKSTFVRTINRLQPVSSGSVHFEGQELTTLSEAQMRAVRQEMVMIFQHFHLIPRMTAFQNTLTGLFGRRPALKNLLGLFSKEEKQRGRLALEQVGLERHGDRRVEALSGGQKQRVGIARALLQEPKLLLGDEPVASLDPVTSRHIFTLLRDIHQKKELLSIVNVHDVSLAKEFATRIIALKDGQLLFDGKPEELDEATFSAIYQ
ncbi:phosphonate ABC transporter ATP-binding protein [Halalkalibacter oceani]|uniref:phosphonate ABC transporter ATP-binding protein n=1 Tax=Halalkalibacter oceani TaxID=1653776 RepID=UPI003395766D